MNDQADATPLEEEAPGPPTQEELYDDLRRIGQLEDQKRQIQEEIDLRTSRLQEAIPSLDPSSLLYQLLSKAMPPRRVLKKKPVKAAATKKSSKKK